MNKILKIIHCSDIHIRNIKRHEEYLIQLTKFIEMCKEIASEYEFNQVRIVLAGDIFHQKIDISNEQTELFAWFLKELNNISPVIIISGNHDFMEGNSSRLDSITPIIKLLSLPNIKYLDMDLNYKSGIYIDENIVWCLYSIFDNYRKPDIDIEHINHPDKKFIGLFHGAITGSKTDTGFFFEHGVPIDIFDGCDAIMCGDIHLRQNLKFKDINITYPGSLIQQSFGESVSNHGFLLWDIDTLEFDEYNIESDYGYYKFKISSIDDIENNTEEFVNF